MKTPVIINAITALLIILYVYTATSKLMNVAEFQLELSRQPLPLSIKALLVWLLPGVEIFCAAALIFDQSRYYGMWFSVLLMSVFTVYVVLILSGFFPNVPCACAGVLRSMGWRLHLVFNLFFLLLSVLGIIYINRERRLVIS